ncbi:hypothetical protein, conserved [Eimeria tenella]|uniref:Uncharacterized protein n=1 Tax=Eimeria tenella TaxID=5802 RepID=U6KT15_EIMTE|nr:hypothetical protein, conserved [Eimeria tenella]CDJ40063.1 hypothetical protein, conserved [Eimeria tenella]|eukprot:XP_013230816.1 hypothetical protein, conserved [Eimeria tenella]
MLSEAASTPEPAAAAAEAATGAAEAAGAAAATAASNALSCCPQLPAAFVRSLSIISSSSLSSSTSSSSSSSSKVLWQQQQDAVAAAAVCHECMQFAAGDTELHALLCRLSLQLGRMQEAEEALRTISSSSSSSSSSSTVAELQVHLIAAALQRGPHSLQDLGLHAVRLAKQQSVSFAAVEGALLLLRQRGLLQQCEEVCFQLKQQQQQQQQQRQQQGSHSSSKAMFAAYCEP